LVFVWFILELVVEGMEKKLGTMYIEMNFFLVFFINEVIAHTYYEFLCEPRTRLLQFKINTFRSYEFSGMFGLCDIIASQAQKLNFDIHSLESTCFLFWFWHLPFFQMFKFRWKFWFKKILHACVSKNVLKWHVFVSN
jgi:hypothetical protein